MRQMVGRVLRGPVAGGDTLAHIVDVRDQWDSDLEILSPVEIPVLGDPPREGSKPDNALPAVRDEQTGDLIPQDVLHRIIRQLHERLHGTKISVGLTNSTLTGFYQLDLMNVAVFEHTAQAWSELIDARLQGNALPVRYPIDMFGDLPIPRPTPYDVRSVLHYIDGQADVPPFQEARAAMSLRAVALSLLDKGAMTAAERVKRIREDYDNTLAKLFFPTFQAFNEAIDREVLA